MEPIGIVFVVLFVISALGHIVNQFAMHKQKQEIKRLLNRNDQIIKEWRELEEDYDIKFNEWINVKGQRNALQQQLDELRAGHAAAIRNAVVAADKSARADALKRAERVAHGFSGENFAPLLMDIDHKDFRHLGDPIDYLVIDGGEDVRRGASNEVSRVILLDIKTGKSDLSKIQRRIRDAIVQGRMVFATYNTDTNKLRCWPEQKEEE